MYINIGSINIYTKYIVLVHFHNSGNIGIMLLMEDLRSSRIQVSRKKTMSLFGGTRSSRGFCKQWKLTNR